MTLILVDLMLYDLLNMQKIQLYILLNILQKIQLDFTLIKLLLSW
jgi:hypothetical protein